MKHLTKQEYMQRNFEAFPSLKTEPFRGRSITANVVLSLFAWQNPDISKFMKTVMLTLSGWALDSLKSPSAPQSHFEQ